MNKLKANIILKTLDEYAKEYDFPVLDNYNFDLAQCRLSVFRDSKDWTIAFEIVGVNANSDIANDLYVYGSAAKQQGLVICIDDMVMPANDEEFFDEDGEFIVDPFNLNLILHNQLLNLKPNKEEYEKLKIQPEPFSPTKLIRYLNSKYKEDLWLQEDDLLSEVGINNKFELIYQTDKWEHTDEEKPSNNAFFQSLAKAIEHNDTRLIHTNKVNTHWSNWTYSDFDKQE